MTFAFLSTDIEVAWLTLRVIIAQVQVQVVGVVPIGCVIADLSISNLLKVVFNGHIEDAIIVLSPASLDPSLICPKAAIPV